MNKKSRVVRSSLSGALLLSACYASEWQDPSASDEDVEISVKEQGLWINRDVLWPGRTIDVCWNNPNDMAAGRRDAVRRAIERTWSMAGNVEFTGWGTCTAANTELRISLVDGTIGPRAADLGTLILGKNTGMELYDKWSFFRIPANTPGFSTSLYCTPTSTAAQLQECAENTAIHEFGHILGFAHEQDATGSESEPDFPTDCQTLFTRNQTTQGTDLYNNDWDLNSVMNYCSPNYGGAALSKLDRDGMQNAYGFSRRLTGILVATETF
jgi:hypothetical protein